MGSYNICHFVSGLFHSVQCPHGASMWYYVSDVIPLSGIHHLPADGNWVFLQAFVNGGCYYERWYTRSIQVPVFRGFFKYIPKSRICILNYLLVSAINLTHSRIARRDLIWEITLIRLASVHVYGAFSWLVTDAGGPSPLWVVPPLACGPVLYKNSDWVEAGKNKPVSSVPPLSRHQFLPRGSCLEFLPNFPQEYDLKG